MQQEVHNDIRDVFNMPTRSDAEIQLKKLIEKYGKTAPVLSSWLENELPEGFTVFNVEPDSLNARRKLRTTNMVEFQNKDLKKRTRSIRISSNKESLLRIATALLIELDEKWLANGKVYLKGRRQRFGEFTEKTLRSREKARKSNLPENETKKNQGDQIMSQGNYEGISIREAMDKINAKNNGWFLPNIQRQYVWGNRDSSEEYICLLVDSLMRGFPIGGLVLWETDEAVPYREFLTDYEVGAVAKIVSEEKWANHKFLVYDGQQRLQTLHSILYYKFNGRVLYYDLLFDPNANEIDETGFFFKNKDEAVASTCVALPELTGKSSSEEKIQLRRRLTKDESLTEKQLNLIETNLDRLWSVFVGTELRSIAYFPVKSNSPTAVNEVFRRLNTGGISLTQLEMVLAKIKEISPYFEEDLWALSKKIKNNTGEPGYSFSAHEIVQLIYLIVFQTTRVDEDRVNSGNLRDLVEMLRWVQEVLPHFFHYFFFEGFRINAKWLILRQQAVLPILAYFVTRARCGFKWKPEQIDITGIRTYFVKSQLCDWNTQTMVTQFSRCAIECAQNNRPFPLDEITQIAIDKNRTGDVFFYQLEGPIWFSLKILTPGREYLFDEQAPQIDHIFPKNLHKDMPDEAEYRERVDVLWNMQPAPAGVNNHKRDKHPKVFFNSPDGKPFFKCYDFLPNLDDEVWDDEKRFIELRKSRMIEFMRSNYNVDIKENPQVE